MALAEACYEHTRLFPRDEMFGLTAQMRRSATSVPANIAEGHGRETPGAFVQFLRTAQGSLKELETHILLSTRVGLLQKPSSAQLMAQCDELGRMLRGLIRSLQAKSDRNLAR